MTAATPHGVPIPEPAPNVPLGPREEEPRRSVRWVRRPAAIAFLVAIAIVVILLSLVAWGLKRFGDIPTVGVAGLDPVPSEGASNWLLVGTDDRTGIDPSEPDAGYFLGEPLEGRRTDTIVLARIDPEAGTIDLLSIPRDLWVPIAGSGQSGRINGAFNVASPGGDGGLSASNGGSRLVATIESALDVPIHHYVEVNFVGFRQLVDTLGGVPMEFEYPARDAGSGLDVGTSGCKILDGNTALALARSRNFEWFDGAGWQSDPTGDVGRTARQRELLAKLAGETGRRIGLSNPLLADNMAVAASNAITLDERTSVFQLFDAARTARSGIDQIEGYALPVVDHQTESGAQVLLLSETAAIPVLGAFRSQDREPIPFDAPPTLPEREAGDAAPPGPEPAGPKAENDEADDREERAASGEGNDRSNELESC